MERQVVRQSDAFLSPVTAQSPWHPATIRRAYADLHTFIEVGKGFSTWINDRIK